MRLRKPKQEVEQRTYTADQLPIDAEIVEDLLSTSELREFQVWSEIEAVLDVVQQETPIWGKRMKKNIKWLRKEAHKQGYEWGRK